MRSHERTDAADEKALNAAQLPFTANPRFLAPQAKHLFQVQQRFFDEAETFFSAWFQRRQDAAQSMIDVTRRMVSEGQADPVSAMKEIVDWQIHSLERLAEDAKDCTEMLSRCRDGLVSNEVETMEEVSETVKRATKTSKSQPA